MSKHGNPTASAYGKSAWGDIQDGRHSFDYEERRIVDVSEQLQPVLHQIKKYDRLCKRLERRGGSLMHLEQITRILNKTIIMQGNYQRFKVTLSDPNTLHSWLNSIGSHDIKVDIRIKHHGMPSYFFCRIKRDYWAEYSLIVEDLYKSPGYVMNDERFIKLMHWGHESYFLRLSHLRGGVRKVLGLTEEAASGQIDGLLYALGRHIFQAAWHEDQRAAILAANHLNLPQFKRAVELLYLALSGELCELRGAVDEPMLRFFEQAYSNKAILDFLNNLAPLSGSEISDIPRKANKLYANLMGFFGHFLATEIPWGIDRGAMPLYKILFANLARLEFIRDEIRTVPQVRRAARKLEKHSRATMAELLQA